MQHLRNKPANYILELTPEDYRLITKGLAMLAGLPIRPHDQEEQAVAESLNRSLLEARRQSLRDELKAVEDALAKANEARPPEAAVEPGNSIVETKQRPQSPTSEQDSRNRYVERPGSGSKIRT